MKRWLPPIFLVLLLAFVLSGCGRVSGEGRELSQIGRELGVDLFSGTLIRFEDSHGGFHGDGLTAAEVGLEGLAAELTDATGWKPLPMSENAARAARMCRGEDVPAEQGWYYLYDRHSESENPYDDTELCNRNSWNFTMAVYDSQQGRLYYYKLDT